jgi:hypothetical protein
VNVVVKVERANNAEGPSRDGVGKGHVHTES